MNNKGRLNGCTKEVFDFIILYKEEYDGISPTLREIAWNTSLTSTSFVKYHLDKLKELGLITVTPKQARGIEVVGGKWTYQEEGESD